MVTASRMPVPEPIAPRKSAITDKPPMHSPPKAAAVGMYLEKGTGTKKLQCVIQVCCQSHFADEAAIEMTCVFPQLPI